MVNLVVLLSAVTMTMKMRQQHDLRLAMQELLLCFPVVDESKCYEGVVVDLDVSKVRTTSR
jgi:hypothetical protein